MVKPNGVSLALYALIWHLFMLLPFFFLVLEFELGLTLARQAPYHLSHSTSCY
jgi:hypothetical protein